MSFIITSDCSFLLYISYENVDDDSINSLMAKNFLLDHMWYNHCFTAIYYIFS